MEAKVIEIFLPDLVTAIGDCVQPVSDQCLAKELIPDSVYEAVLESKVINKDKARYLILAVINSIKTDSSLLEIFLSILDQQPICKKLSSDIREQLKVSEKTNVCRKVIPIPQNCDHLESTERVPRETALLQSTILSKYEDSIRKHERIRLEKDRLEEIVKEKSKECESLKEKLEALKSKTGAVDEAVALIQSRLTACEGEVETLETKFFHLENILKEKDEQVQEEKNTVISMGRNLLEMVENTQEEIKDLQSKLANQERENKAYAADKLSLRHLILVTQCLTWNHPRPSYWKRLGEELGFSILELETIERVPRRKIIFRHSLGKIIKLRLLLKSDDWFRLEEMLRQWLIQYPEDSRGSTDFPAYSKLQTSLVIIGVGSAARDLITYNHLTSVHP